MRALLPSLLAFALQAQVPAFLDQLPPVAQAEALDIVKRADFMFETQTQPKHVRLATMEKLFDHPVLGAAMWRFCQFVPAFYAFIHPDGAWSIVEGRAERGRLKVPFPVGARMLTSYRYWEGKNGFESHLQTWTALDSAVLGILARPARGYIKGRQDEFIAYINGNVATFGEFAELSPRDFHGPLKRDGDAMALREFEALFTGK